jgi:hypothetical protein
VIDAGAAAGGLPIAPVGDGGELVADAERVERQEVKQLRSPAGDEAPPN